jgi:hypothetical protein
VFPISARARARLFVFAVKDRDDVNAGIVMELEFACAILVEVIHSLTARPADSVFQCETTPDSGRNAFGEPCPFCNVRRVLCCAVRVVWAC